MESQPTNTESSIADAKVKRFPCPFKEYGCLLTFSELRRANTHAKTLRCRGACFLEGEASKVLAALESHKKREKLTKRSEKDEALPAYLQSVRCECGAVFASKERGSHEKKSKAHRKWVEAQEAAEKEAANKEKARTEAKKLKDLEQEEREFLKCLAAKMAPPKTTEEEKKEAPATEEEKKAAPQPTEEEKAASQPTEEEKAAPTTSAEFKKLPYLTSLWDMLSSSRLERKASYDSDDWGYCGWGDYHPTPVYTHVEPSEPRPLVPHKRVPSPQHKSLATIRAELGILSKTARRRFGEHVHRNITRESQERANERVRRFREREREAKRAGPEEIGRHYGEKDKRKEIAADAAAKRKKRAEKLESLLL